jgi:hypothetical protein
MGMGMGMMHNKLVRLIAVAVGTGTLVIGATVTAAQAQDPGSEGMADKIVNCASIEADVDRLFCFDELARPLVGLAGDEDADDTALFVFKGSSHWQSDPLDIEGQWRATWQFDASIFSVELRDEKGFLIRTITSQTGQGGGRSDVLEPGRYRLSVRSLGDWTVRVTEE